MGIKVDTKDLSDNLKTLEQDSFVKLQMYCNTEAKRWEGFAKRNRPWTDRTTRARQSLNGFVENLKSSIRVCIAHGVWYGVSLETEHEKRYAILMPTVKHHATDFMKGLSILWKGMNF